MMTPIKLRKTVAALFLCITILVASFYALSTYMLNVSINVAEVNLKENAENNAKSVRAVFLKDMRLLDSFAQRITEIERVDSDEGRRLMRVLSRYTEYVRMAIDMPDGTSYTSDGHVMDINELGYLADALNSDATVTPVMPTPIQGQPKFSIIVPIQKDGKSVGALRGVYKASDVFRNVDLSVFNGEGTFYLIDKNGRYISEGNSKKLLSNINDNFLTAMQESEISGGYSPDVIKNDFAGGKSRSIVYTYKGKEFCAYYTPLGFSGWYAASIVPVEYLRTEQQLLDRAVQILLTVLAVLFALLLSYIVIQNNIMRKKIEAERELFKLIINRIPIPVFITNMNKELRIVNDESLKLFGGTREEVVGKPCNILNTKVCDTPYCSICQLTKSGNVMNYITKNNRSYQVTGGLIYDIDGNEFGFVEAFQDITEVFYTQQELEDKTIELETISENMAGGLVVTSLSNDYSIIRCNDVFCDLIEADAKHVLGRNMVEWFFSVDIAKAIDSVNSQLSVRDVFVMEVRLLSSKKNIIWVSVQGKKAELHEQEVGIWLLTDISYLKETEEKLRISEELYRIATSNTEDIILDYNIETGRLRHTETATKLYGVPMVVENAPYSIIEAGVVDPSSKDEYIELFRKVRNGEKKASCVIKAKAIDKNTFIRLSFTTIFDNYGKPVRAIGIIQDITKEYEERRKYEKEHLYRNITSDEVLLHYEVDITEGCFVSGHEEVLWSNGYEVVNDYETVLELLLKALVYKKDQAMVRDKVSLDFLRTCYNNGTSKVVMEYRRNTSSNDVNWCEATWYLFLEEETRHVRGLFYLRDINENKKAELALRYKAERDLLTGIYNKITFESMVKEFMDSSDNTGAFMLVDLDDFKSINDTLGHAFGDAVISEVARNLDESFGGDNIVGRIGGDEFAVFLKNPIEMAVVNQSAERMCEMFHNSYTGSDSSYKVSGTIGISLFPSQADAFDLLYKKADVALYHSKRRGKDTYGIYEDGMNDMGVAEKTKTKIDENAGKVFSENITEYVLRILYEAKEPELAINAVLELVTKYFNYSRGYVFIYDKIHWNNIYEWCVKGIEPQIDNLKDIPVKDVIGYKECFDENGLFVLKSLDGLTQEWLDILTPQNIRSMVQCSILDNGEFSGFIGFDDCVNERLPSNEEISVIRFIAILLGSYITNQKSGARGTAIQVASTNGMEVVLNSIDNFIYVIDKENYKIKFLNKLTTDLIPEAKIGDICYPVLRGKSEPCADCPMKGLIESGDVKYRSKIYNDIYELWIDVTASDIVWESNSNCCLVNCMKLNE